MLEIVQTYWLYFLIGQYPNGPLGGLALTLILAACGLVLALPLGVAFGLARVSPWRWLRWPDPPRERRGRPGTRARLSLSVSFFYLSFLFL